MMGKGVKYRLKSYTVFTLVVLYYFLRGIGYKLLLVAIDCK